MPAYGSQTFSQLPYQYLGGGLQSEFCTIVPPGSLVNYVCSSGVVDQMPSGIATRLFPTLAAALPECRAGKGDFIFVLPGHTENVSTTTMLANLVAGTKIIGLGSPDQDDAPTFSWTATTAQWNILVKNVMFANLRLLMDGIDAVAVAVNIATAGVKFMGNYIRPTQTAKALITGFDLDVGGNQFVFAGNTVMGTTGVAGGTAGDFITVDAAVADITICGNHVQYQGAAVGDAFVNTSAAATRMRITDNEIYNHCASSTTVLKFANVASTGICSRNIIGVNVGTGGATNGIITGGASNLVKFNNNFTTGEAQKSGILCPAATT